MFPRFALGLGYLIFLLAVGLILLGVHFMSGTVPNDSGSAKVPGISATVDIDRDDYAIPHIHAATEHDAYFGLGYAEAQDRLFQMELERRLGEGRMSELFGPRSIPLDTWARTIGFARIADEMWRHSGSHTRDVLTAFVSGINAYLKDHRSHLSFEFDALTLQPEDWRPQDCLVIGRLMSWEMNFSYMTDAAFSDFSLALDSVHLHALFPQYPDDGATVIDGADPRTFVSNYLSSPRPPLERPSIVPSAVVPAPVETPVAGPAPALIKTTVAPARKKTSPVPRQTTTTSKPSNTPKPAIKPGVPPPKPRVPKRIGFNQQKPNDFESIFSQERTFAEAISEIQGCSGIPTGGSNAFAVSPARTTTGGAILENDAHLQLGTPSRWYLAHLLSDDGVNVAGFSIPGVPVFLAGRTPNLAWGITNGMSDECDYFAETLDSTETRYLLPNGMAKAFEVIRDTIRVRDSIRTNPMLAVPIYVRMSIHGPVLNGFHPDSLARVFHGDARAGSIPDSTVFAINARPIALMWNGTYALSDELGGFLELTRATSVDQARREMAGFATPCLNLCLADTRGNIAYQFIGRLPRRAGSDARQFLLRDGRNPADAWQGFVYMPQLPTLENPPRGYIVTANNPPIKNRSVPFGMDWEPSSRADRISELIEERTKKQFTTVDAQQIQTDIVSSYDVHRVLPYLLALYPDQNPPHITPDSTSVFAYDSMQIYWKEDSLFHHTTITDSAMALIRQKDSLWLSGHRPPEDTVHAPKIDLFTKQVLDYLRNWDGGMRTEEIAPAIYSVFLNRLIFQAFHDELGTARYNEFIALDNIPLESLANILPDSVNIWWDDVLTPGIEHRDTIIQRAFRESLRILAMTFGPDIRTWQWGRLHTLTFRHPFDKASKMIARLVDIDAGAMPGGPTTVMQATYYLWAPYEMQIGPSMRMVTDLKQQELLVSLPTGNSEAIFGDHYKDMLPLYKSGALARISLTGEQKHWKRFELTPQ